MFNVILPIAIGFLLGNKPAREKTDAFIRNTLKSGINLLNNKGGVDNGYTVSRTGGADSGSYSAPASTEGN